MNSGRDGQRSVVSRFDTGNFDTGHFDASHLTLAILTPSILTLSASSPGPLLCHFAFGASESSSTSSTIRKFVSAASKPGFR
jgi:hypothetical protein